MNTCFWFFGKNLCRHCSSSTSWRVRIIGCSWETPSSLSVNECTLTCGSHPSPCCPLLRWLLSTSIVLFERASWFCDIFCFCKLRFGRDLAGRVSFESFWACGNFSLWSTRFEWLRVRLKWELFRGIESSSFASSKDSISRSTIKDGVFIFSLLFKEWENVCGLKWPDCPTNSVLRRDASPDSLTTSPFVRCCCLLTFFSCVEWYWCTLYNLLVALFRWISKKLASFCILVCAL